MGLALYITYLFATKAYSRRAGLAATFALGLMPNVFYHAHLACFDVPIMAMWIACVFAYWTADVFGLDGKTTPETHMRYAQWALLAPVARYFWRPPAIDGTIRISPPALTSVSSPSRSRMSSSPT